MQTRRRRTRVMQCGDEAAERDAARWEIGDLEKK